MMHADKTIVVAAAVATALLLVFQINLVPLSVCTHCGFCPHFCKLSLILDPLSLCTFCGVLPAAVATALLLLLIIFQINSVPLSVCTFCGFLPAAVATAILLLFSLVMFCSFVSLHFLWF